MNEAIDVKLPKHKPTIETLINSAALSLFSFGIVLLTTNGESMWGFYRGLILILLGTGLEWFKYIGRQKEWW